MNNYTLVTGGTGFIGSHLVKALAQKGRKIRCLVRQKSDIAYLKSLGIEIVYGDLLSPESLKKAVKDVRIVYHLAAQVRPDRTISSISRYLDSYKSVNTIGTKQLADLCLIEGVKKFIYYSSIAAAGAAIEMNEDYLCSPITHYGKTKLEAENYLFSLFYKHGFPVIIIRPGQIYGPRAMGMLLLFRLIKNNCFFTIGNGCNIVPLCYIDDLIKGTLLAEEKGEAGNVYFITGQPYTFKELVHAIAYSLGAVKRRMFIPKDFMYAAVILKEIYENMLNVKICPFRMDISKGGVISISSSCSADLTKSRNNLGYSPEIGLTEGIMRTVEWYREKELL